MRCCAFDGEFRDDLRLAVIGELEIVDGEIIDRVAFGVADDDRDGDEVDAGTESDGGFFRRDFRVLRGRGNCGEKRGNQNELGSDSDGLYFILSSESGPTRPQMPANDESIKRGDGGGFLRSPCGLGVLPRRAE